MVRTQKKLMRNYRFLLVAILVAASIAIGARVKGEISSPVINPESQLTTPIRGPVQVVRFTLYDVGIYPQEAHARQGLVTVSIEDLSGASSGLIVERVDADVRTQVGIVDLIASRLRARGEMLLVAGRYEVSDARQRSNKASLIIEP